MGMTVTVRRQKRRECTMMLKRMLGPMVMEMARRGWMPTSSVKYKFIWTNGNPNCVENSIPKFQLAHMSHYYAGYPRKLWNFFCDCPRPGINNSQIGVFNFWALL